MSGVTIVVPCYNEEARLDGARFLAFTGHFPVVRFLLVDDGSTDGTARVLEELCRARPDAFSWLSLERNSGKAEAVRRGVLAALEEGAPFVGFWDADLAAPLDAIPIFRAELESNPWVHLVMGSRVQMLGRRIERTPVRHYLGRVFATVVSLMLGVRVYDTQCGAKLFRATDEVREAFRDPFLTRWLFDVEILARLIRRIPPEQVDPDAPRVHEIPLRRWRDVSGSKLRPRHMLRTPLDLFTIWRAYLRG